MMKHFPINKEKMKKSLVDPMQEKDRLMKMEHLLSNNYVIAGMLIVIDLLLFFALNYVSHLLVSLPGYLLKRITTTELFSLRYLFPAVASTSGFLVFLFVAMVVDVILVVRIKIAWGEEHFNVGQKGRQRFTTPEEIKEQYLEIDPLETRYRGEPGILIARIGDRFYIDTSVVNNLILGITRSGKGELLAKTSIEIYSRAMHQPSLVINDPKLEHYKVFAPVLEQRGYKVFLLNASNPVLSMGFNLLAIAVKYYKKKEYDAAEMVVNSISYSYFNVEKATGDMTYFTNAASDLFAAMSLATIEDALRADEEENAVRLNEWKRLDPEEKQAHPFRYRNDNEKTINLYSMIVNFQELVSVPITKDGRLTKLDQFFEDRSKTDRAKLKYLTTYVSPGKTKSSVFAEMLRELSIFTLQNVARMTAESSLDMEEIGFGKQPVAVFLATPSYDSSLYKLPVIFIRQMYYVLGKLCEERKGMCSRQVKIILDEKGNMPPIELMEKMISTGLGQNISFDLYLQNYEQMTDLYGRDVAETIKGNCGNHYYLLTNSEDTAREFSKKLGSKSYIDVQRSGKKLDWDKYFTESVQDRPLLDENDLRVFTEGECVIARTSKRRNLKGKKIRPYPIYNSVENGQYFWYSYEYMPKEKYPNPNEVNFLDICKESRAHIDPQKRIWDLEKSWEMMHRERQKFQTLGSLDYAELSSLLEKSLGQHFEETYGIHEATSIAEAIGIVQSIEIPQAERESLIQKMTA